MESIKKLPIIHIPIQLDDGQADISEVEGKYYVRAYGPMLNEKGELVRQTKESEVGKIEYMFLELFLGTNGRTTQELMDFVVGLHDFMNRFGLGSRKPNLSLDRHQTEQ